MMKFFLIAALLFTGTARASDGSSIGNWLFRNQLEFDFRIGYLKSWSFGTQKDSNDREQWLISNQSKVTAADKVSYSTISFLDGFPAQNRQELLAEIQRKHPGLKWSSIENEAFTIGFVSDQQFISIGRTQNFEYYFSEKNKVIRIEAIRDQYGDGETELSTILATVRRASGLPKIVSISSLTDSAVKTVAVGKPYCYRIAMDPMRGNLTADNMTSFNVRGAPPHWSFKSVNWNPDTFSFEICVPVNSRFGSDGLAITNLMIASLNGASLQCSAAAQQATALKCQDDTMPVLGYTVPKVDNPNPTTRAPQFLKVTKGSQPNSIHLSVQSAVPLAIGQITLDLKSNSKDYESQIIYPDQLKSGEVDVAIDSSRLKPGFTRVLKIMLTDQVGNISELQLKSGEGSYTLYTADADPMITPFAAISVVGGSNE